MPFDKTMHTVMRAAHIIIWAAFSGGILVGIAYWIWRITPETYPSMTDMFNALTANGQFWFMAGSTWGAMSCAVTVFFSGRALVVLLTDLFYGFSMDRIFFAAVFATITSIAAPLAILCAMFGF